MGLGHTYRIFLSLGRTSRHSPHPSTQPKTTNPDEKGVKPQWKAAIDFWDNKDAVAANINKRNSNASLDLVLELYHQMLNLQKEVELLRGERKAVANKMKAKLESSERQKLREEDDGWGDHVRQREERTTKKLKGQPEQVGYKTDAKRLIGRRFSDASVQGDMKLWPFKVTAGPADKPMITVSYKGEEWTVKTVQVLQKF